MAIKALPADASQLLVSSSLVISPTSLVKELVDNSIDAQATCIEVLISPNSVDQIEVRDNGHGILHDDFDALGKLGYTSKITSLSDLQTRAAGGASLGFRGQGLAAATTLGHVRMTTRTKGESAAVSFRLVSSAGGRGDGRGGGVVPGSLKPTAAPVGTSVTVTCLFASLPVRRRAALCEVTKTIAAIKRLLCGYALSRPRLRLNFKVLRQPAAAWTYHSNISNTPRLQMTPQQDCHDMQMREAVRNLFGNEVAQLCQGIVVSGDTLLRDAGSHVQQFPPTPGLTVTSPEDENTLKGFVFEAFLPNPGTDLSKLTMGSFISVDGRPLSSQKRSSIVSKLRAVFQSFLDAQTPQQQRHVRDAFFLLNMSCPAGSYDPNIEPSKTDVLFFNERLVCDAFEQICSRVYKVARYGRPIPAPAVVNVRGLNPQVLSSSAGQATVATRRERPICMRRAVLLTRSNASSSRRLLMPPSSNMMDPNRRAGDAWHGAISEGRVGRSVLARKDGYRQTTISFGRLHQRGQRQHRICQVGSSEQTSGSRVRAADAEQAEQTKQAVGGVIESPPVNVMTVDLARLERAFLRFVSGGGWKEEDTSLSSIDRIDVSLVRSRLRQVLRNRRVAGES